MWDGARVPSKEDRNIVLHSRFLVLALAFILMAATGCADKPVQVREDFHLEVIFPQKPIVVTIPYVEIEGRTSKNAVVTINGEEVDVSEDWYFSMEMRPDVGHNAIEIIARDPDGNEIVETLSITWASPEPRSPWGATRSLSEDSFLETKTATQ